MKQIGKKINKKQKQPDYKQILIENFKNANQEQTIKNIKKESENKFQTNLEEFQAKCKKSLVT